MLTERKLPKKLLKNYIAFDVSHAMKESLEEDSLNASSDDSKKLGCIVMIGEGVTTVKVGDEVYIPNIPSIQPLILTIEDSTYLLFREADIVAVI